MYDGRIILVEAGMRRSCGGAGYPSLHVNVKPILTQDLGHWIRILQTIFKIIQHQDSCQALKHRDGTEGGASRIHILTLFKCLFSKVTLAADQIC